MRAIQASAAGGPDVLELVDLPDPEPRPDEVLVRVAAAGVNFIDTYRRAGVYPMPFPHVVGSEGAGLSRLVAETCDQLLSIPMANQVESLNAGVAASVALYAVAQARA